MKTFWLCFVPLFVAVDALGMLPVFMNLTEDMETVKIRKTIVLSVVTAMIVALVFLLLGKSLLALLGITVADFMVAGGVLLFCFSLFDILSMERKHVHIDDETIGAVPIGVPLITGPALITTTILLVDQYGHVLTITATVINILFAGLLFWFAQPLLKIVGKAGVKTISKLSALLLASIAVMIIRKGVFLIIR